MDKVKEYDMLYAALKAVSSLKDTLLAYSWDKRNTTDFIEAVTLLAESSSLERILGEAAAKRLPYKMFFGAFDEDLSETEVEAWLAKQDIKCGFMGGKAFCFISSDKAMLYGLNY